MIAPGAAAGRAIVNVVPRPATDRQLTWPPCPSTTRLTTARPSPRPPKLSPCTKSEKTAAFSSGVIPTPWSLTEISTPPLPGDEGPPSPAAPCWPLTAAWSGSGADVGEADTTMRPPSGENFTALSMSSSIAIESHLRSARTGGVSAATLRPMDIFSGSRSDHAAVKPLTSDRVSSDSGRRRIRPAPLDAKNSSISTIRNSRRPAWRISSCHWRARSGGTSRRSRMSA